MNYPGFKYVANAHFTVNYNNAYQFLASGDKNLSKHPFKTFYK